MVRRICQLIETDDYTVREICKNVDINVDTFYAWKNDKPEFSEALKKADDVRLEKFKTAARSGLLVLLNGKEYEEVLTEMVAGKPDAEGNTKPVIKSQRKIKKFLMPNPTSVIFALKNLDEERFSDIFKQEHTGADGGPIVVETITGMKVI